MSARTASWLLDHGRLWYDDRWYRTAWIVWPQAIAMLVFVLAWAQPGSVPWGKPAESVPQKPAEQGDVLASSCASGSDFNRRVTACSNRIDSGKLKGDDLAEAYYRRGSAYFYLKQSQSAMSDYNRAIAMAPSDPVYLNDRGILFRDLGDNDNAMQDFNKAIAIRPNYALAYANRGYIQRSRHKLDEAIADASTAIKLDPKSVWAYENRAFAYEDKEQWRALFDDAQKMIELSPNYRLGYEFRGHAYLEVGQYQDAVADFTKCIAMDSTAIYGYRMRGRAYYFLNQFDSASADFQAALRIDPKDETTISFFNDLKRRNPASASQSPSVQQSENYANELTDWGISPQSELKIEVGSQTPLIIPGGRRVTTGEVVKLINTEAVIVDVLRDNTGGHRTLPGAIYMPGAGDPGTFKDRVQRKLSPVLAQLTSRNANQPLVFLCEGAKCWESYNAALRAMQLGYRNVLWYRGGLSSWIAAKQQLQPPAAVHDVIN
jgi:PQQ-dependent catabolism-associated CXXCW motif protein